MKAQIIIEYEGNFTEEDLQEEVRLIENEIVDDSNDLTADPKFDTFKVSSKILKA